jgi:hypothetical protein
MTNPIIDLLPVQDITVTECSRVERIGPLTRLVFTIQEQVDDRPCRRVVSKLLMPTEMVAAIAASPTSKMQVNPWLMWRAHTTFSPRLWGD